MQNKKASPRGKTDSLTSIMNQNARQSHESTGQDCALKVWILYREFIIKTTLLFFLLPTLLTLLFLLPVSAAGEYDCSAGKHDYNITSKEPTAANDGEKIYECKLCSYSYTQILPATNHLWDEWIIDKPASCTESGEKHRICKTTNIPHSQTDVIAALGHDYRIKVKKPSCTEAGLNTYTCGRCGDTYTEISGQASGHDYKDEITTPSTYDKEGVITYTCKICGDAYTQVLPKTTEHEHKYTVKSENGADCERDGHVSYACTICGHAYTQTLASSGHSYGEWITDKEPSLFNSGHRYMVCANNPEHILSEDIPRIFTPEVNTADAVMAPINTGLLTFFLFTLFSDLYVIFWDLRMRCKTKKSRRLKTRYILTAAAFLLSITCLPLLLMLFIDGVTYFNLLGITAMIIMIPTGIILRLCSHRRRKSLNGNGGIYEPGAQKGELISMNKSK